MNWLIYMLWSEEKSNKRLVQYGICYPFFYAIFLYYTSVYLKVEKMDSFEHLLNNSLGAMFVCLVIPLVFNWRERFTSKGNVTFAGFTFPREWLWLLPSGVCTAVVIPTTTLMYGVKDPVTHQFLSVVVALPLMRASLILTTLVVDLIQIVQGISRKKLVWQEFAAALLAFGTVWFAIRAGGPEGFNFVNSPTAIVVMSFYIVFYTMRQYIMSHYKNTQSKDYDVKGFFVVEQAFAAATVLFVSVVIIGWPELFGWENDSRILAMRSVLMLNPELIPNHGPNFGAILSGLPYGAAAFFSVFLFMFHGKTQTFAVIVNRLASLVAAPVATWFFIHEYNIGAMKTQDLQALIFVLFSIGFLAWAEFTRKKNSDPTNK